MKLLPYINFNGNCAQAIAFYEKVFGTKAEVMVYKDAERFDPNFKAEKGRENWVMHSCMKIADGVEIQFADCDENGKNVGTNVCLQINYKTTDEVMTTYSALKKGARIICDAQSTFYSPMYAELVDKFGIRWSIIQEHPVQEPEPKLSREELLASLGVGLENDEEEATLKQKSDKDIERGTGMQQILRIPKGTKK